MKKSLILIVILIAAGALVYSASKSSQVANSTPGIDDAHFAAEEPNDNADDVVDADLDDCPDVAPTVEITNGDSPLHEVRLDGVAVGTISLTEYAESEARIYRQTKCNAWIAASATGRGGYILYGGDDQLYRLNFENKTLTRVEFDGGLNDLSSDETMIASGSMVDGVTGSLPVIIVTPTSGLDAPEEFATRVGFDTVGSAKFSPDGTKIAYAAVERDDDTLDPIQSAVFIIDLKTGVQTIVKIDLRADQVPYITGWLDDERPIVSDTP